MNGNQIGFTPLQILKNAKKTLKGIKKIKDFIPMHKKIKFVTGFTLWLTGLPCSGKTTVANGVAKRLKVIGLKVEVLDGDVIRQSLTKDLGFSKEDRDRNIERVTFVAKLLSRNGVAAIVAFVSPYRQKRREAREETTNFVEVYLKCPIEECMRRDAKGMYEKALAGEIKDFTGVSDPYEEPQKPDLILETDKETPHESINKVIEKLKKLKLLPQDDDKEIIKARLKSLGYM